MILALTILVSASIYFFIMTLYYRSKYKVDHSLVELLDESTLMYYKQMVDIDIQNSILQKQVESLKLENSELRSSMYMGFPNRSIGGDAK